MINPMFNTNEVAQLYEEVKPWCHTEYPFLDPNYSPASSMAAIDFTPYVTTWLQAGKDAAVIELWTFLASDSPASQYAIRSALTARLPEWIELSDTAEHELRAIYILSLRASWGRTPEMSRLATSIAAMSLACRQMTLKPDYEQPNESMRELAKAGKTIVLPQSNSDVLLKVVRSDIDSFAIRQEYGNDSASEVALQKATSQLGVEASAAERLKAVPPMVRRVVYDYLTRSWGSGVIHLSLYFDERAYGCGAAANQQYVEWLGFFCNPTDQTSVPTFITKAKLLEALASRSVEAKKSAPRAALVNLARGVPGLISSLVFSLCPERRDILPEWEQPLKEWALRVHYVEPVAAALIKLLAASTVRKRR